MELNLSTWIFNQWQRKIVALMTAIIVWVFVNNSITDKKTIPNIAVKVINLPADKAIIGLLPNSLLSRRVTLTLSGTKDVINDLEAGDIEVVLDASTMDNANTDEWIADINKKNLVSLNPSINLARHITQVEHGDFVIHLSHLVTAKVPVMILPIIGEAPPGYTFIDVWPQQLFQTLSGPEEEIVRVQAKGLQLELDISQITKADLEQSRSVGAAHGEAQVNNEVVFFVPHKWKKIAISYCEKSDQELNDPDAKYLHLTFLQKQLLPLDQNVPIEVYYPLKTLAEINPELYPLSIEHKVTSEHGLAFLNTSLYAYDVSRLFLERVKNSLQIAVVAALKEEKQALQWSLDIVGTAALENEYVATLLANEQQAYGGRRREQVLRQRFRTYLQRLALYQHQDQKLHLECILETNKIVIK